MTEVCETGANNSYPKGERKERWGSINYVCTLEDETYLFGGRFGFLDNFLLGFGSDLVRVLYLNQRTRFNSALEGSLEQVLLDSGLADQCEM